jgi:putative ABC transport system permease protein
MPSIWPDVRSGLRLLTRAPGFAVAAILMLGLGVGSSTAIFAIVDRVLLQPLPFRDSSRIVTLSELTASGRQIPVALPNYRIWVDRAKSFEALAAIQGGSTTIVTSGGPQRGHVTSVHGDALRVFGYGVAHGRALTADELRVGAPVAVVPHSFATEVWRDAGRGVGEVIRLGNVAFTIVGVLEPDPSQRTDAFVPATAFGPDISTRSDYNWNVLGRLRDDVSLGAARAEMDAIARRVRAEHADNAPGVAIAIASLLDATVRTVRPALLALLAAGGLLLLIACANVANLLLARGVARRREIAVRLMLGASRARVIRQLVVENLPIAALSAATGILLARWSFSSLVAAVPFSLPRRAEIAMGWPALSFGLGVAFIGGLLFALLPALQAPGRRLTGSLGQGARTTSRREGVLRHALVAGQFALALAVLSCAGLLTRSLIGLAQTDTGFDYARALVAEADLPSPPYATDRQLVAFWREAIDRVKALPGVEAAGVARSAPLDGAYPNGALELVDDGREAYAWYGMATSGYFEALDIPLLQGRWFDERDAPTAPHVAVINRLAADKIWPGQNPIGRRIRWPGRGMDAYGGAPLTIVGVIGDVRHNSLATEPVPEVYANFAQRPARARNADLVVRTAHPAMMTAAVKGAIETIDPNLPVRFHTLASSYSASLAQPRFLAILIGFFAACALLLSAVGLYSSMAYAVGQRTREIGIRLALGGAPGAVRRQVVGTALRIAGIGAVFGALLGIAGGRLIANQLVGVSARDPIAFLGAGVVLGVTALLAAHVPARRASRTSPIEALRGE